MTSFSIFLLIFVFVAGVFGWKTGLMKQIGQVAGVVLGIAACRIFGSTLVISICGEGISGTDKVLYTVLIYIILFAVIYIVVSVLMAAIRKILRVVLLGFLDRLGGAVFRIVEWLVLLSLVLNLFVAIMPNTSMISEPLFDRVLWFGPYLLGTETAIKLGSVVSNAITG